jgi:HD-GYP domain-containing protein (c-di-GMP phosphodiesterase class II)
MDWSEKYIEHTRRIKILSGPPMDVHTDGSEFYAKFQENFSLIRELLIENKAIIKEEIDPYLKGEKRLDKQTEDSFDSFIEEMNASDTIMSLDFMLCAKIEDMLIKSAKKKSDEHTLFMRMDMLTVIYSKFCITTYMVETKQKIYEFRQRAIEACRYCISYTKKNKWAKATDEEKIIALRDKNFFSAFYSQAMLSTEDFNKMYECIKEAQSISANPYYQNSWPENYDIAFYNIVTDYRLMDMSLVGKIQKLPAKLYEESYGASCRFLLANLPLKPENRYDYSLEVALVCHLELRYLTGRIDYGKLEKLQLKHFHASIKKRKRVTNIYDILSIFQLYTETAATLTENARNNAHIAESYGLLLDVLPEILFSGDYLDVIYAYFASFISKYIDTPQGEKFEDYVIHYFAMIHPPTFVHSRMVAEITAAIAEKLIEEKPETFIGILGAENVREVTEKKHDILKFAKKCGLYHDIGKSTCLPIITIYYRSIYDSEFDTVKLHAVSGYRLLMKHASSKAYAETALLHHVWYDGTKGYPLEEGQKVYDNHIDGKYILAPKRSELKQKGITDIVAVADSIDAATDTVGRSYSVGKTFVQVKDEIQAGAGTRYSPLVAGTLNDTGLCDRLREILGAGRKNYYFWVYDVYLNK